MTPQFEAIVLVKDTLEDNLAQLGTIGLNPLPTTGGIVIEIAPGNNTDIFLNKQANKTIPLLFLAKGTNQVTVLDNLYKICNYLQGLKVYPQGETVAWNDAEVSTEPSLVDNVGGYYTYSCIIDIKIYF